MLVRDHGGRVRHGSSSPGLAMRRGAARQARLPAPSPRGTLPKRISFAMRSRLCCHAASSSLHGVRGGGWGLQARLADAGQWSVR